MPIEVGYDVAGLMHQLDLWQDQTRDTEIAIVGPYGCGKSYGLAIKQLLLRVANRGTDGMLVVPTFTMARMIHIPEWPKIWSPFGIHVGYESQRQAFLWPWGDRTWIRSAENPQRLAGPNLGDVSFDEPGQMAREAYERGSVRARHPKASIRQVIFGGTPEGMNWFADLFAAPEGVRRTIWARTWHADLAEHYPSMLLDRFGYDESLFASYAEGKFVPLRVGRCYKRFDRVLHQKPEPSYDANLPLLVGCDFNVDTMRWQVAQMTSKEIRFLDEISLGRSGSTEEAARELVRRWSGRHRGKVMVTGDASGQARSTSGPNDYQVLREELKGKFNQVSFSIAAANPRQKDRVDLTNYHLSGRGRSIHIAKACRELALDWERVAWKKGTAEIDKTDPERTHASDAADYLVWQLAQANTLTAARGGSYRPARSDNPAFGAN